MNSEKSWNVKIDEGVYGKIAKIPKMDSNRILAIMESPLLNPYQGDIEKMKGEKNVWRRRIGAYRIFYEVNQHNRIMHIFLVERRTSGTY